MFHTISHLIYILIDLAKANIYFGSKNYKFCSLLKNLDEVHFDDGAMSRFTSSRNNIMNCKDTSNKGITTVND